MKLDRKWLLVIAVVLSLAMVTTGTLAYLTDSDTKVNTFTVGNVDIEVEEEFEQDSPLNPGVEVEKQAGITNTHDSNDAWVWMTVSVPEELDAHLELGWSDEADYTKLDTPVHDGYVSYLVLHPEKLQPGETTPMYLEDVMLAANVDYQNGEYVAVVDGQPVSIGQLSEVDIIVDGFAIQPDGFDNVQDAYDAYVGQWDGLNGGMSTGTPVDSAQELLAAMEEGGDLVYTGSEPIVIDYELTPGEDLKVDLSGAELVFEDGGTIVVKDGVQVTVTDSTITADGSNTIFEVKGGSTLTLGRGAVLEGAESAPSGGLIRVEDYTVADSKLVLAGAEIKNNNNGGTGELFHVGSGSTLVIEDGTEISGNAVSGKSSNGNPYGLMTIASKGVVEMNGGKISGNTFDNRSLIDIAGGKFSMNGGEISGNEFNGTVSGSSLIRIATSASRFEMSGGAITGNTIGSSGSSVVNAGAGTGVVTGGEITGNTASKTATYIFGSFTVGAGATVDGSY